MDYRYNYDFLPAWMEENKLTRTDITRALGTRDYHTVNRWMNKEAPVNIEAILRLSNTFNIPLAMWFLDGDAPANVTPKKPDGSEKTEPTRDRDGRDMTKGGRRGVGAKAAYHQPTVMPRMKEAEKTATPTPPMTDDVAKLQLELQHAREIAKIKDEAHTKMDEMQRDYDKKRTELRESLTAIINDQQRTIDRLTADLTKKKPASYNGYAGLVNEVDAAQQRDQLK